MNFKSVLFIFLAALPLLAFSQMSDNPPDDWFLLDKLKDGYMGVSSEKAYSDLLKGKPSKPVIVAVIDGGVDYLHEDLKDVMWKNPGEIPANKIDDDRNGYVDDIYGWNFIGGKDGRNVNQDQLEITRIYASLDKKFKNADASKLSGKDKKSYDQYKELEKIVLEQRGEAESNLVLYSNILEAVNSLVKAMGKSDITVADVEKFKTSDPKLSRAKAVMTSMLGEGGTVAEIQAELQRGIDYFQPKTIQYDPDFDGRSVVGDNYADVDERYYGNPDVKGLDSKHGTHVSGIIGASRGNGKGMDGIADNVRIMAIRCVPDGDERDKDVANSIIYAVDNGASVINMSFGKGYSPNKKAVDKAVKYAMKHDVLLIHGAGNDHEDNDKIGSFPNDKFEKPGLFGPKKAKNWIEVGAISWKGGEDAVAEFSNYGKKDVDLFAPGVYIYATTPENNYEHQDGTSMASPVVAGVAALIRSRYPDLSAVQVKDVLMSSTVMTKENKVKIPGEDKVVPFSDLCVTGGVVNVYEAAKKAATVKGKKKASKIGGPSGGARKTGKPNKA